MYIECPFKFLISVGQCEAVLHIFEPGSKFQLGRGEVTIEDQLPLTSGFNGTIRKDDQRTPS